jgi:hypothetical protein
MTGVGTLCFVASESTVSLMALAKPKMLMVFFWLGP